MLVAAVTEPPGGAGADALVQEFAGSYPFALDDFQRRGCRALAQGRGTLVAAPTGAGKTIVGEFAVWLALRSGGKAFYTTPLKALSNQKYNDFVARHGTDRVGLLTGDNSINGEAPVVVMTTEVLRNMLYDGSGTLAGLRFAVMDEVHYLQDRVRGAAWEEVLINLPVEVRVASLSATVSNAEEFGEWLDLTRGPTDVVIEEARPVPLDNHYMLGRELHPLFITRDHTQIPNPQIARRAQRPNHNRGRRAHPAATRKLVPARVGVVDELEAARLLPAIYFIFSRAGCDQALSQARAANLRLTGRDERDRIRDVVAARTSGISDDDLDAVGFDDLADGMERGIATHHAGMLPVFKEAVEELFAAGLIKVVFATETLSLGINMPARTVVIERLLKWQGERHELLTPGQYTQLTGRAGRRGIDQRGASVVLHQPFVPLDRIAGLASTRTYPLTSSFRPSYNMAVNLVANYRREEAEHLLASSFAQFLADRTVGGSEQALDRNRSYLQGYRDSADCDRGDVLTWWALLRRLRTRHSELAGEQGRQRTAETATALRSLTTGTVIRVPGARRRGLGVVFGSAGGHDGSTGILVMTEDRRIRRVAAREFDEAPVPVGRISWAMLPRNLSPKSPRFKARVAEALAALNVDIAVDGDRAPRSPHSSTRATEDAEVRRLAAELDAHPVNACPDTGEHERWLQRHDQLEQETSRLEARVRRRTHSLVRTFEQVLAVLEELDYVHGFTLTEKGQTLRRIYAEADLLASEALHRGTFDGLDAAELAAVVSTCVYEPRGREALTEPVVLPTQGVRRAVEALRELQTQVHHHEQAHHLQLTRPIELDFADRTWRWARGEALEDVLDGGAEITAGDFVRVIKQLIDLLGQLAAVAPHPHLAEVAHAAATACRRGVVAYSSVA